METGNRYIDFIIALIAGGILVKLGELAWKGITVRFLWRKEKSATKSAEFETIRKEAETLEFLEMRLKAVHSELEQARTRIEEISEKSRRDIRDITNKSLDQLEIVDKRAVEQWQRMKEMRDKTLILLAEADAKNPHH